MTITSIISACLLVGALAPIAGCRHVPDAPPEPLAEIDALTLTLRIAPDTVSADSMVAVTMNARNDGLLPVRARIGCAADGFHLRNVAPGGAVTPLFGGIPCGQNSRSSEVRIAPGESVGKTESGSARLFLPDGVTAGSHELRLDYVTDDRELLGPRVLVVVRAR